MQVTPFQTPIVDPRDSTRTLSLTVNGLIPPHSGGTISAKASSPFGEQDGGTEQVESHSWVAHVSRTQSTATNETVIGGGDRLSGHLSIQGSTAINGTGHLVGDGIIHWIQENGERILLGAGHVEARPGQSPNGPEWQVVRAQLENGVNLTDGRGTGPDQSDTRNRAGDRSAGGRHL